MDRPHTDDYKNGYNDCVEKMISYINQEIHNTKSGETSVNDVLRMMRRYVLDTSFQRHQSQSSSLETIAVTL